MRKEKIHQNRFQFSFFLVIATFIKLSIFYFFKTLINYAIIFNLVSALIVIFALFYRRINIDNCNFGWFIGSVVGVVLMLKLEVEYINSFNSHCGFSLIIYVFLSLFYYFAYLYEIFLYIKKVTQQT